MSYSDCQKYPFPTPPYSYKAQHSSQGSSWRIDSTFPIALYSSFFVCGSFIDSNSQNICQIFFKKQYPYPRTRRRGCKLKAYLHVQGEGESKTMKSERAYFMDEPEGSSLLYVPILPSLVP